MGVFKIADFGLASGEPVLVTDHANRIVHLNRSASDLLGLGDVDAQGLPCWRFVGGTDVEGNRFCRRNCPLVRAATKGEMLSRFEAVLHPVSGSSICVTVYPLALYPGGSPGEPLIVHVLTRCSCAEIPDAAVHEELPAARPPDKMRWSTLTAREIEVLRLMSRGVASDQIARQLFISLPTVRTHVARILTKLDAHSKLEAVARARQLNLV
jgi:DNA-binding CsgD family transcriptional regulator